MTDGEEEDGEGDRINGGREDPELEQTHVTPKDRKWREKDTRRERAEEILPRQNPRKLTQRPASGLETHAHM